MNNWRKPLTGQLALNVDASFVEEDYSGSCGAIIRDHRGMFIAASTSKLEHVRTCGGPQVGTGYWMQLHMYSNGKLGVVLKHLNRTGDARWSLPLYLTNVEVF